MTHKEGKILPYNKHESKVRKTSVNAKNKGVKPVAKDTNKTRRRVVKPTK